MAQEPEVDNAPCSCLPSDRLLYLAVFLLVWVFYGRCVGFDFTNWDDTTYLVRNPVLHRHGWDAVVDIFTPGSIQGESLYIPITYLSYWFEARVMGLTPQSAHAVNVMIHAVNAVLVLAFCHRLSGSRVAACAAAVLFVIHPLQVESVAWAFGRKDLLATCFALAALCLWVKGDAGVKTPWRWTILTVSACLLAMLSKPSVLILPALIPLLSLCLHGKDGLTKSTYAATAIALAASIALYTANHSAEAILPEAPPLAQRLGLWPYSLTEWLPRIALVQQPLTFYPWPTTHIWLRIAVGVGVVSAILAIGVIGVFKRWRLVWFAIGFLAVTFAPTLNTLVGYRKFFTGDRYGYFPMIAVFLLAGIGFTRLMAHNQRVAIVLAVVVLSISGWRQVARTSEWKDSVSLWSAQKEKLPNHPYGHGGYGKALDELRNKRPNDYHLMMDAQKSYQKAVELGSKDQEVYFNLGNIYTHRKRYTEAEAAYRIALNRLPSYVEAMVNLGLLYYQQGRYVEAEEQFLRAAQFNSPLGFRIYMNLTSVYEKLGRSEKALEAVTHALRWQPQNPDALQRLKRLSKANPEPDQKNPKSP